MQNGFILSYKKETCLASPPPASHHPKATAAAVRPPAGHMGNGGQGVGYGRQSPILHNLSRSSNMLFVSLSFRHAIRESSIVASRSSNLFPKLPNAMLPI